MDNINLTLDAMDGSGADAAKMRQTESQFVPSEAGDALHELLDRLRPWGDERAVSSELREWAERFWPPSRGIALGVLDIAAYLRLVGPLDDPDLDSEAALGMTFHMLRNVWAGRTADQSDLLGDTMKGFPDRTMRRYRREHGQDALFAYLNSLNRRRKRDLDLLVKGGRKIAAARRLLERNPGKHFEDLPPPRRPRGPGPPQS